LKNRRLARNLLELCRKSIYLEGLNFINILERLKQLAT